MPATGGVEIGLLPGPIRLEFGLLLRALHIPGLARQAGLLVAPAELLLAPIERAGFLVDNLFFLFDPALDALDFFAALGQLAIELRAQANRFVFGLESGVASSGFRLFQDAIGFRLHLAGIGSRATFQVPPGREEGGNSDEHSLEDAGNEELVVHRHPCQI